MKKTIFAGYVMSFALSLAFIITFMVAYFNGGKATFYINLLGEANLEFIIITISLPFIVMAFYRAIRNEALVGCKQ